MSSYPRPLRRTRTTLRNAQSLAQRLGADHVMPEMRLKLAGQLADVLRDLAADVEAIATVRRIPIEPHIGE